MLYPFDYYIQLRVPTSNQLVWLLTMAVAAWSAACTAQEARRTLGNETKHSYRGQNPPTSTVIPKYFPRRPF